MFDFVEKVFMQCGCDDSLYEMFICFMKHIVYSSVVFACNVFVISVF